MAQAGATSTVLLDGRFCVGLGSGEALNEHISGDRWPEADERLEMREEAVEVIRKLWQGGVHDQRGRQPDDAGAARSGETGCRARGKPARLEHCRIYDLPESPPEIVISGFGPKSVELAARIGDGYVTVGPDSESVEQFRSKAKRGKQVQGGLKVCWDRDESKAVETVHRRWPNDALPGELAQVLPTPAHFEQASELVTPDMVAAEVPCGPDLERHIEKINENAQAGFDELYVQQIGPEQDAFFEVYREHVLPRVR